VGGKKEGRIKAEAEMGGIQKPPLGGGASRKPRPTKEVQLWEAVLAATRRPATPTAAAATRGKRRRRRRSQHNAVGGSQESSSPSQQVGMGMSTTTTKPRPPGRKRPEANTNWAASQQRIVFRGKERETPKPPKPTRLKRVILVERERAESLDNPPPSPTQPLTPPPEEEEEEEEEEEDSSSNMHSTQQLIATSHPRSGSPPGSSAQVPQDATSVIKMVSVTHTRPSCLCVLVRLV